MEKKYYVLKMFTGIKPMVAEEFPYTHEGYKDACDYAAIMTRNSGKEHIVVS